MARAKPGEGPTLIQRSREGPTPEEKAVFHQVVGAGKAKRKREFFDLGAKDVNAITERLERALDTRLARER